MADNTLLLSRAKAAVISRDFTLAVRLYRQLLRDDRDNIELLNQLGNLYMKSGRDDQALPVFKRISELNPEDSNPLITIGGIYRRLKKYEESIAALEEALVADGTNALVSYNLGFTYKEMGQLDDAVSCFEDAIEMNPSDTLAYNHIGVIYAEKKEYDKALQSYLRGLNVDANHPVLLLNVAQTYEALGENDKAAASYEGALRSKPLWTDAIDSYGKFLVKAGRGQEAYAIVKRALDVNSKDTRLAESLERIRPYANEEEVNKTEISLKANDSEPVDFEEVQDDSLPRIDDKEFDAKGLEISLQEQDFEIQESEMPDESIIEEAVASDDGSTFDFESMGMDQLANDVPVDEGFFEQSDENMGDEGYALQTLDNLADDEELPVDIDDTPDYGDSNGGITDDLNSYTEPEDPFAEVEDIFHEPEPSPEEGAGESEEDPENEPSDTLPSDIEEKLEEAKRTLEKANYAAEQAWMAAQQAADSAQLLDAAKVSIEEEMPLDEEIVPADEIDVEEESLLPQDVIAAADMLPSIISQLEDPEAFGQFKLQLEMFKKLRELLDYLPVSKRDAFLSSETRLLLDYIILRLSGTPGLYATVNALLDTGVLPSANGNLLQENAMPAEKTEKQLLSEGIEVIKKLTEAIKDDGLRSAMMEKLMKLESESPDYL